ncbi:PD-(D/E)XK motif protein [Mycolicibacterium vaccae]|uniref:PD-(D/E)XK motif protein n=1 Tax=Mycolicibacterium vaccae TaxID=1810 RepID=UPI003D022980
MITRNPKRHLSRAALDEYLDHSSPSVLTIPGEPICRLVVDPAQRRIALRTSHDGRPAPALDLEYIHLNVVHVDGDRWYELSIEYADHPHESYLLISDITDLLQQEGVTFEVAVVSAVATFEQILAHSRSLSREKQIGLFGELLFLIGCIRATSVQEGIESWKGFAPNEHDFVFPTGAFEIKTTTTEARRHRISGLEQLRPLPDSPLWLISIQLTAATPATGRTLSEIVDEARELTSDDTDLARSLARAGWRERDRDTYRTPYRLRSTPAAYLVDSDFPALTRQAIARGCAHPELFVDASYIIDVTTLSSSEPTSPADQFIRES